MHPILCALMRTGDEIFEPFTGLPTVIFAAFARGAAIAKQIPNSASLLTRCLQKNES